MVWGSPASTSAILRSVEVSRSACSMIRSTTPIPSRQLRTGTGTVLHRLGQRRISSAALHEQRLHRPPDRAGGVEDEALGLPESVFGEPGHHVEADPLADGHP